MRILKNKRCMIGEGPVWNTFDKRLYFVNGMGEREICTLDPETLEITAYTQEIGVAALAFTAKGRLIASRRDGVFYLNMQSGATEPMYDPQKYQLQHCNDAKVGPDGRLYVGTQSEQRLKISDRVDGKLYRIDYNGKVDVLLDGLILSNGMDWSLDERFFYHADSGTKLVREYEFDRKHGDISFTGREVFLPGADGLTVTTRGELLVACWGKGHLAVVDTKEMTVSRYIDLPVTAPASCGFFGESLDLLAITTASYKVDTEQDPNAGYLCIEEPDMKGRAPFLFGSDTSRSESAS